MRYLPYSLRVRLEAIAVSLWVVAGLSLLLFPFLAGCGGSTANFIPVSQVATPTPAPTGTSTLGDNYLSSILPAHWDKQVVTFRVSGGDSQIPLIDMPRTTRLGAELWNPALVGLVQVDSVEGAADIEIVFVPAGALATVANGGVIGRTVIQVTDGGIVRSAKIEIDRSLPPGLMQKVATHEVGHALGVRGHSPQDGDVMYYRANGPDIITDRDRNTVRACYGEDVTRAQDSGTVDSVHDETVCKPTLAEIQGE